MSNSRIRVKVAEAARHGEQLHIKTLIMHHMETGLRSDAAGEPISRHIINRFVCTYDGEIVFDAELNPAVAANPYLEFNVVASHSGTLSFQWFEDGGRIYTAERQIDVT